MIIHQYKCWLQEPLILFKKAKTEQSTESLDYLPGANFRGLIANNLFNNTATAKEIDDIIFNGNVQFGDAHLEINGQPSHKIPMCFYEAPLNEKEFQNFHLLNNDELKTKRKPKKEGYIIGDGSEIYYEKVVLGERLKSARLAENRSSEDEGMYFYKYIADEQAFIFQIKSDEESNLEKIKQILESKNHYLGKSKSSEFGGKAEIKFEKVIADTSQDTVGKIIYAASNLCFLNEFGEFSAWPTAFQLTGDSSAKIDWEKSQVRYRTYAPYNFHRQAYDAGRLIIEKGSVFVLDNDIEFKAKFLSKGIGCFTTEGFGQILVSPAFLMKKTIIPKPKHIEPKSLPESLSELESSIELIQYLIRKNKKVNEAIEH